MRTVAELEALPEGELRYVRRPDGTRLRTLCRGAGPTVVLAHGYLGAITNYNLVFEALVERGHRVVAFDQRAHGGSSVGREGTGSRPMAADYAAVLEELGVEDGVLVGHSMGSFLSVAFCLEHPEVARARLRSLVLVGGTAGDVARGSLQNRVQLPLLKYGVMPAVMRRRAIGTLVARTLFGDDPDPVHVEVTRRGLHGVPVPPTLGVLRALVSESFYPRLGEVPIPATVLSGEADRTCPRWHSERLGAEIPGAHNVWLPGVGHVVPYEAPLAIVEAVERAFEGGEAAAAEG